MKRNRKTAEYPPCHAMPNHPPCRKDHNHPTRFCPYRLTACRCRKDFLPSRPHFLTGPCRKQLFLPPYRCRNYNYSCFLPPSEASPSLRIFHICPVPERFSQKPATSATSTIFFACENQYCYCGKGMSHKNYCYCCYYCSSC